MRSCNILRHWQLPVVACVHGLWFFERVWPGAPRKPSPRGLRSRLGWPQRYRSCRLLMVDVLVGMWSMVDKG